MGNREGQRQDDELISDPERWVDEYGDSLYGFALSRVQDPAVAEDLVQETFLAALQTRQKFEGRSSLRTWLIGILKHKVIDHIRRRSREQSTDDLDPLAEAQDRLFDEAGKWKVKPAQWATNPLKLVEEKEFWRVFTDCLSELPGRMAQAFMLREMDGLKGEEIRNVLGVSATNCGVILYRARMHLRRCLELKWFGAKPADEA
jgi:RNA polymerase sigma-70 factor (ECF subfamily)